MKKLLFALIFSFAFLHWPFSVRAAYVLPYPSFMPGNKFYPVMRLLDETKRYWYWGNLSSYKYYQGQSDKALVEAKTLFEYHQYLFAMDALQRSNRAVEEENTYLLRAGDEGIDLHLTRQIVLEAMSEHETVLKRLIDELPQEFVWTPEKQRAQVLSIRQELIDAQTIRIGMRQQIQNE